MPLITCMCPFFVFLAISIRLLSPFSIRQKMIWTNQHDILLCREILVEEPYKFKHGSRERGQCWNRIANALSRIEKPSSRFVTSCARLGDDALTALVSGPCAASSWAASWIVNSLVSWTQRRRRERFGLVCALQAKRSCILLVAVLNWFPTQSTVHISIINHLTNVFTYPLVEVHNIWHWQKKP